MGTRTEHTPGTFSWVDLATNDSASAKSFYGSLFGWEFDGNEIPGGGTYAMCQVGGENVAAIAPATDRFPPHWNSYVTVESADDAAARAKELGGNLIEEPFDVMEAGRMALFEDPTGAALCVWQPDQSIGATRVNDPGSLTWNEPTAPTRRPRSSSLAGFGWAPRRCRWATAVYTIVKVGDRSNGGVMASQRASPRTGFPTSRSRVATTRPTWPASRRPLRADGDAAGQDRVPQRPPGLPVRDLGGQTDN